MRSTLPSVVLTLALAAGSLCAAQAQEARRPTPCDDSFAITGARVFDGAAVLPNATVLVRDGRIVAVGPTVEVPPGVTVVDGTGSTLMPGIIDAHAHAWSRADLERALMFGVTTELGMWSQRSFVAAMKREQERNGAPYRADMFSAINPATVREGYPYNFTPEIEHPTIESPAEAPRFVRERFEEGADYLKIFLEDGSITGYDIRVLTNATIQALTREVHNRGKLAVAHVTEKERARDVVLDGADGLAHIFLDELVDPAFVSLAASKGIFVVGTLSVEESFITTDGGASLIADPEIGPYLTEEEKAWLLTPPIPSPLLPENLVIAKENVRLLHGAGIPILAGTDAATHGLSIHRDLELMVDAGLSPLDALIGATSAAADAFRLHDRGRIAPGLRADLILVAGDPSLDIKATRAIRRLWKGGVELERVLPATPPQH